MTDINSIINVTISVASPGISRIGFGEPGVYAYVPAAIIPLSSRTRRYGQSTGLADMVVDGFAATDPAYLCAQKVLSQSPKPKTFKILCNRTGFTHDFELLATTFAAGELLEFTLTKGAVSATYSRTAVGGSLAAEATAIAVLVNADATGWGAAGTGEFICAGVGDNIEFDAVDPGVGANDLWGISAMTNLEVLDVSADRGIAADLGLVLAADSDWYDLIAADAFGAAELAILSSTIQSATNKGCSLATQDTITVRAGTGISLTLSTANATRTHLQYSAHSMLEYPGAASSGRFMPEIPGTVIRAMKTLTGVTPSALTTAQSDNAHGNFCNTYEGIESGGVELVRGNMYKGWSSGSSESWIDNTRLIDALVFEVQLRALSLSRAARKVPFTNKGIGQVKGAILAGIKVYQETNPPGLTPGSEFCDVPDVKDVSLADKDARQLPNVTFGATLTGGIIGVTATGTLQI